MLTRERVSELVNLLTLCVEPKTHGSPYEFLCIDGGTPDPILHFWKLYKDGALKDGCHVVFTNIRDSDMWDDLAQAFGGSKFGCLFMMKVRVHVPKVCPSQRGMYMK